MKKQLSAILAFLLCLTALTGCGKIKTASDSDSSGTETAAESTQEDTDSNGVFKVKITPANIYDYFEYTEIPAEVKDDNGTISNVQVSYALKLKDAYVAADPEEYDNTLKVSFTARGVVMKGDYTVDFDTLEYSGTTESTEYETVSEELTFWPKGNRTTAWTFGNYSTTYILYFESFTVTTASGNVYLQYATQDAE